jgi:hypothetical protein
VQVVTQSDEEHQRAPATTGASSATMPLTTSASMNGTKIAMPPDVGNRWRCQRSSDGCATSARARATPFHHRHQRQGQRERESGTAAITASNASKRQRRGETRGRRVRRGYYGTVVARIVVLNWNGKAFPTPLSYRPSPHRRRAGRGGAGRQRVADGSVAFVREHFPSVEVVSLPGQRRVRCGQQRRSG